MEGRIFFLIFFLFFFPILSFTLVLFTYGTFFVSISLFFTHIQQSRWVGNGSAFNYLYSPHRPVFGYLEKVGKIAKKKMSKKIVYLLSFFLLFRNWKFMLMIGTKTVGKNSVLLNFDYIIAEHFFPHFYFCLYFSS